MTSVEDRKDYLSGALSMSQSFTDDLSTLSTWVEQTKDMLKTQQGHVGSVTDQDEMDSIAIDPQVRGGRWIGLIMGLPSTLGKCFSLSLYKIYCFTIIMLFIVFIC